MISIALCLVPALGQNLGIHANGDNAVFWLGSMVAIDYPYSCRCDSSTYEAWLAEHNLDVGGNTT
ncbi:MAG: uncharacterized protein KVP18_002977 [Porospora cf. gigantea A]|uniref:uncharacterized protein n=1 Tax=Porospora cf. gigantea A TaxID=2853593 RepID=UPI00355A0223|nr:MAG: hypothetical protein KVP18_002977 [Porospora cf. gigantea A]